MLNSIIINGINGNIGKLIYEEAKLKGISVSSGIDKIMAGNFDCPVHKTIDDVKEFAEVIIDFSSASATESLISFALSNKMPLVIGTTGQTARQEDMIVKASKTIPIFKASNTSECVFILERLAALLAKALPCYDIEIIERHHRNKADAPSGTAISIANAICSVHDSDKEIIYGRRGKKGRSDDEICIHALRGGTVTGEHEVIFYGNGESLSVKHTAESKKIFAIGALKAAEFIIEKNSGLYTAKDLYLSDNFNI